MDMDLLQDDLFAVYTRTGDEELLRQLILALLADVKDTDIFIPQKIVYKKAGKHRRYKCVTELFKGYVFLRTRDPEGLYFSLKTVPRLANLLHDGDFNFVPLDDKERNFIELLCSLSIRELRLDESKPQKLLLPASTVKVISKAEAQEGDLLIPRQNPEEAVKVISGPLLELAQYVTKVDYSNRKVVLDLDVFGEHSLHIGIRLGQDEIEQ